MNADTFAIHALWLGSLSLPVLIFFFARPPASRLGVAARAIVAIGAGWAFAVAYVVAAQAIVACHASPERVMQLYDADGAPRAFAVTLGWVLPAAEVALAWLAQTAWRRRRTRA